jgi:hypothetical protein
MVVARYNFVSHAKTSQCIRVSYFASSRQIVATVLQLNPKGVIAGAVRFVCTLDPQVPDADNVLGRGWSGIPDRVNSYESQRLCANLVTVVGKGNWAMPYCSVSAKTFGEGEDS